MRFFLVNPDYMLYGDPPLGLAYLAAYIREKCNFVNLKILDQLTDKEIIKKIKKEKPDIIGLTAVSLNYPKVKRLAEEIKKQSTSSLLILGGVHITTFPESFKNSPFDIAVLGEGEIPSVKFLNHLHSEKKLNMGKLSKIPGFLLRDGEKIINTGLSEQIKELDSLPLPARDLLNMRYYKLPRFSAEEDIEPIGTLLTSRGCPYSCKFCSSSSFWGRKIRFFSPDRVVKEIEVLNKEYYYNHVYIYDDLFSINKARLKEIILKLREAGLLGKIRFSVYGRANCFDEETAILLQEMNVKTITFGFETGSQRLLNYLKGEHIKVEDAINALKIARKYGLNPGGFFMLGSPTETIEDMEKTYDFIKDYCRDNFIVYQTIPFPGTDCWNFALKNNIINKSFYEHGQRKFVEIDSEVLLSKEVSAHDFKDYFYKIKNLSSNKKTSFLTKITKIRPRHIKMMLTNEFFRKVNCLKSNFLKRSF